MYNNAPLTIAPILDAIGSAGGLRIGLSPDYPAAWIPENFKNNFNASYMLFDPSVNFLAFDETGRSFSVETRVVFAHELSHSTGRLDVASDLPDGATSDALMNTATFDHVGDNLRYEHQVSDELGISTKRLQFSVQTNTDLPFDLSLIVGVTSEYFQYAPDYDSYSEGLIVDQDPVGYTIFADFGVV